MPFDLTDEDDGDIGRLIEQVLKTHTAGGMSLHEAQADLAHAMVVAAVGDERAFKNYIRLPIEERAQV